MKNKFTIGIVAILLGIGQPTTAQVVIQDNETFVTKTQMFLANELFESGEPFAEELNYNLDDLDPLVPDSPDSISYTTGIEGYEYSRYLLNTLNGRSGLGLNMMWSPIVTKNAAMQGADFDGKFTGGTANGFNEDDMLKMIVGAFGMNANFTPFANPFPQFAEFTSGNMILPQPVEANYRTNYASSRWDRSKMDKTLNLGGMGQSMWKQYWWAQDMLGAFHDENDDEVVPDGTNSPDLEDNPNFDPSNNIFYGGNNIDGFIGQILTAAAINKTAFLTGALGYDGTNLGPVDLATYNPANGIQYFPTKIEVTETIQLEGLPPKATALSVTDGTSQLFDQLSYLLATTSYMDMMNPNNTDEDHYGYREVFDGYPFPASAQETGIPGPFDLMKGTSKVIFLNIMAMHYNSSIGTFVNESSLNGAGTPVMGNEISAENAAYIIQTLSQVATAMAGTPLVTMANDALVAQADYILANFKDANGGFFNSVTVGSSPDNSAKTLAANAALVKGLYEAYSATSDMAYLNAANDGYNFMINNFYVPGDHIYKSTINDNLAVYTPWNMALFTGAMRTASLIGNQPDAAKIYTRVSKTVFNRMILCEGDATGETGNDSDGDGIPYIVGSTSPFVFANKGTYQLDITGLSYHKNNTVGITAYPNPTTEYVSVDVTVKNTAHVVNIEVYDLNGRIIAHKNAGKMIGVHKIKVGLKNIHAGNYILRVNYDNDPVAIEKLIIAK